MLKQRQLYVMPLIQRWINVWSNLLANHVCSLNSKTKKTYLRRWVYYFKKNVIVNITGLPVVFFRSFFVAYKCKFLMDYSNNVIYTVF